MSVLAMDDPHICGCVPCPGFTRRIRDSGRGARTRIHRIQPCKPDGVRNLIRWQAADGCDFRADSVPDRPGHIRALADAVLHREDGVADAPPAMAASIELMRYYADLIAKFRRRPREQSDVGTAGSRSSTATRLSDQEIMAFLFSW